MSEDHLSNEVSISAELTPTGVKAGAKSRLVSAIDRIAGGLFDLVNVPLERAAQKGRAKTTTDTKFIEALGGEEVGNAPLKSRVRRAGHRTNLQNRHPT